MKSNPLVDLSKQFAVEIINICADINKNPKGKLLSSQLLRSGTSIGANIHEGNYAQSRPDFISKFQIALKECYETEYWLDIFKDTDIISDSIHASLHSKCAKIRRLLISSITTAKSNSNLH